MNPTASPRRGEIPQGARLQKSGGQKTGQCRSKRPQLTANADPALAGLSNWQEWWWFRICAAPRTANLEWGPQTAFSLTSAPDALLCHQLVEEIYLVLNLSEDDRRQRMNDNPRPDNAWHNNGPSRQVGTNPDAQCPAYWCPASEAELRQRHWHEWYVLAEMQKEADKEDTFYGGPLYKDATGEKRKPFDRGPLQQDEPEDGDVSGKTRYAKPKEYAKTKYAKPKPDEGPRHALREMLLMWKHMLKRGHTASVHHKASSEQGVIDRQLQVNRFVFAKHVPTVG